MTNARGKSVDTTSLSIEHAMEVGWLHRDYLAHYLRWSHIMRYMTQGGRHKEAHVLDVGCGKDVPLSKIMFHNMKTHTTGSYTGVDYGKVSRPETISEKTTRFNATFLPNFDFSQDDLPRDKYDIVVCLEVLEHVEPMMAFRMLQRINQIILPEEDGGIAFLSTPCYDQKVGAAKNHVNEMTFLAFKALIELSGLYVESVHGTFASQKDYKPHLTEGEREVFDKLRQYYDATMVSCFFAPLHPDLARNCLWRVRKGASPYVSRTTAEYLLENAEVSSSSEHWHDHFTKILAETGQGT